MGTDDRTDGGTGGLLGLLSQLKSFRRVLNVYIQIFCGPIILIPAVRIKIANLTYTKFPIALFLQHPYDSTGADYKSKGGVACLLACLY